MEDTTLPADSVAKIRALEQRITRLERRQNLVVVPLPVIPIFGNPEIQGFYSHSQSAVSEVWRCDGYVTAPVLDYDIQQSDAFATTSPTSITVEIELRSPEAAFADTTILTDTQTPDGQIAGFVDLLAATSIGEDIIGRFVSFRVGVGRLGGSGDAAAVRLNKPFLLRIRS